TIVEELCDFDESSSTQVPFVRTTTLNCRGVVISEVDKTPAGQAYTVKNDVRKCVCEETQIMEQLCDVTRDVFDFDGKAYDSSQRSWTLPNDVVMTNTRGAGIGTFGGYNLYLENGSNTFTFSEPVDVEFGLTFFVIYPGGDAARISQDLTIQADSIRHDVVEWDATQRIVKLKDGVMSNDDIGTNPIQEPRDPVAVFKGQGITQFTLDPVSSGSEGVQVSYLKVTTRASTPFLRTIVLDCDGVEVSSTDTTLSGESYDLKGTVGPC